MLPYSEKLNTATLGRIFDNKSECYKLFWFQAIMTKVSEGKTIMTFEDMIDEMIADAWYMVSEYHLSLGPRDNLEAAVNYISSVTNMAPAVKKQEILDYLHSCDDKNVFNFKTTLTKNVPYRLQAPFLDTDTKFWECGTKQLSQKINQHSDLMYYFIPGSGLQAGITISKDWEPYLLKNQDVIRGWLQYNMIIYLQRRNPNVPGIADKLYPPQERKLEKVKKYWKVLTEIQPVLDIYGSQLITPSNISIDHFVPWSYVANDEFWNLHPTTKSINSSKSNNLPNWEHYFPHLASLEYKAYQKIWQYDSVHKAFDICAQEHLNSVEIQHKLYRQGLTEQEFRNQLAEIIYPVYLAAKNCGFRDWEYKS